MNFRGVQLWCLVACIAVSCVGCSSGGFFTKESVETKIAGVVEDSSDVEKTFEYFQAQIDTFIVRTAGVCDSVTKYENLKALGLNPEAKNVTHYRGPNVLPFLLGTSNPQIQISKPEEMRSFLEEYGHYLVIEYELRNIKSISDAVYFSNKETRTEGTDLDFIIILKDGVTVKHYFRGGKGIDATKNEETSGGGLIETLRGVQDITSLFLFFYLISK